MKIFFIVSMFTIFTLTTNFLLAAEKKPMTTAQKLEFDERSKDINVRDGSGNSDMKFHCGFTIPVSFEPEIMRVWEAQNGDGAAYCAFSRYGLKALCENGSDAEKAAYKKILKEKIKKIHCYVADKPKAIDVSYKDGTMKIGLGPKMNDNNIQGTVIEFVKANF